MFRDALDKPLSEYRQRDRVDLILANPPFGGTVANNNEENFPLNYRTKESADLFFVLMMHRSAWLQGQFAGQDGCGKDDFAGDYVANSVFRLFYPVFHFPAI
jgi:type I restriction-modification system DNA methylase subunit